ncbi:MAG: hypothetical protein Q4E03_03675 [Trueperella sp.]|nr:hypothetical protein [Trueperella sp.]
MWQQFTAGALAITGLFPMVEIINWDAVVEYDKVNISSLIVTEEIIPGVHRIPAAKPHVIPAKVTKVTLADICARYRETPVQLRQFAPESLQLRCSIGGGIVNAIGTPQIDPAEPASPEILAYHISAHANEIVDPGVITIQPNRAEVWVNKDVYFTASAQSYTTQLTILGQQVELRFDPVSYTWRLGDGTVFQTATAGGPWPHGNAHAAYRRSGTYTPAVEVTWEIFLRTGASPWTPVPGSAHTVAYGDQLNAIEMEAVLTTG